MSHRILILDDELEFCLSTAQILRSRGFTTCFKTEPAGILETIREKDIELVLLDIRMPSANGLDLLQLIKRSCNDLPVVIISGHATIDITVQAMKYGALNLYTKPIETKALVAELNTYFSSPAGGSPSEDVRTMEDKIVFTSPSMGTIVEMCDTVARTTAPVLITGESGTGKELLVNRLWSRSDRAQKAFYKINCAAMPESLLDSQLFGHEKGAFTGACSLKKGFFELASDGTIFLDEIAELTPAMQAKLLRVLQEKEFIRVGGSTILRTDARILSATNMDIRSALDRGAFREDIYYRLAVVTIQIPPLRERREDIVPLTEFFIQQFSRKYNKGITGVESRLRQSLLAHSWPGNIRELRNLIERAIIFAKTPLLTLDDIPLHYKTSVGDGPESDDLAVYFDALSRDKAKEILFEALEKSHGKRSEAARLLNITRKTLYNRLRKYQIDPGDGRISP